MKLKVEKAALLDGLQAIQNIVGIRTSLPILSNVLITAENSGLFLTTTDLDITMRSTVEAEIAKTGSSTLPVKRFSGAIKELPNGPVEIEIDDKNTASVRSESSFYKLLGLSCEEFPPAPKTEGKFSYRMDQGVFKDMLKKTSYAVSVDETRYVLNGLLLSFKGAKLTVVGTDGRRLALVETEVEFPKGAEADLILPGKAVNELLHTLGDSGELKISGDPNVVIFELGKIMIATKLIEGTYPNYRQVIPSRCEERITVEREILLIALRRVAILAVDKAGATKLTFSKNKLVVTTITPDIGEAKETLPIKYSGKEISVAFNPEFMMDPLKNLSNDEVYIELTDEMSPGVFKCDSPFLYVLMPMRVG